MIEFSIILILVTLLLSWNVMSGFVYRKPFFMIAIGLCFCFSGAIFISSLEMMAPLEIFKDVKLSLSVVNYTIAAAGGSLIAGGLMLKAQHAARNERIAAERSFYLEAKRISDHIESFEEKMKKIDTLDVDEFKKTLVDGKVILYEKIQALKDKKEKLDKLEYE
ncbi:hypothetical protein [Pectobacterium polaris]|uniref:Uncharacterized protein n=1 Tax=Pectobacterium polaris TaxID=2042057 RepID=A0AAW5GCM1_9GAMM|nr:hypothetical protein [Pectobacterium polaris]MCL6352121.1 hypothetical protein [Pectobacterium polaris]MCL6369519.1 hypothetical protein [Pectobacterium polaris]MDE8741645.1 hypothetical protein [Pectobacterium polaris]MDG0802036.1 hypothetical protein [Pectobacterium polaris]